MNILRKLIEHASCTPSDKPLTSEEFKALHQHLDHIWKHLGIEIDFTKHFVERANDPRNKKQITVCELEKLFTDVATKYGTMIANKVKPESDSAFDSVLTDISTKVNSPVIVEWDKQKRRLRLYAKTVMRVNHFYAHEGQPRLTVQHYEPQGTNMIKETTQGKSFTELKEWLGWNSAEVAPIAAPQAVDDVDTAAFSVETNDVLDKLNAYCHDISHGQYINPYYPINALWRKLMLVGLNFDVKSVMLKGTVGTVRVPMNQFGGRYGLLGGHPQVSADDGISHRLPGGLVLVVAFTNTRGIYTLDVHLESGHEGHFGMSESEAQRCGLCGQDKTPGEFCSCVRPTKVNSTVPGVANQPAAPKK